MHSRLLHYLARAVAKNAAKLLCNLIPGAGAVYDIAADAYDEYRRDKQDDALRADLEALAQAAPDEVNRAVAEAVAAEAGGQPAEIQHKITAYLTQMPAMIRRSLRRPSDPTGTTLPATLSLSQPEDLVRFLPPRLPRFKSGDRPLAGVDWVLEEMVGLGGFGEVWKARHAYLRNQPAVALKFCLEPGMGCPPVFGPVEMRVHDNYGL
jgi:eukaryotic-like serine/threonine-protein kinase